MQAPSESPISDIASINSPAPKRAANTKGKRKVNPVEDDDVEEGEEDGRKRKRNRMSLSCKKCKSRKVKCDRVMPECGPCTRRGRPNECSWEAFATEDGTLPSTIARAADLLALTARLTHVEEYLRTLPPNLASFNNYSAPLIIPTTGEPLKIEMEETFSDTEDAAVNLENGVFMRPPPIFSGNGDVASPAASSSSKLRHQVGSKSMTTGVRELRFGGKPMEYTKVLTSIISQEKNLGSFSKAHLNVEFDALPEDVEQAWKDEQRKIYRALPTRGAIKHLVSLYFSKVSWLFHHLHAPSFFAELEAFDAMWDAGRLEEVDVLWLALLCIVLGVALDSTHTSRSPLSLDPASTPGSDALSTYSDEELRALPERLFQASQRALTLGEWESVPCVRTLQTIILFTQYLQLCSATRGQPSQLVTWLAGAIRIAQVMRLHQLGSNPETMPADDIAWPPGKNSLKRESAKRIWSVLVFQDWMGANSQNRCYLISPLHFDTDDPLNLNDSDMSSINWIANPAPVSILTDSSSDRVRIAMSRQVRKVFDALVITKDSNYETVLKLDAGYREILETLPERWTSEISADESEQPKLRYQRHFALEGLHNRIFRLHRPFATRGYSQSKYRFSTDACLKSARVVVISTHNLANATSDVWFTYSHVMGAALVLFNDLFQAIDHEVSLTVMDDKRDILLLASEIFARRAAITSPSLQAIVDQGSKILAGLFRAEEARRDDRAARTLMAAAGPGEGLDEDEKLETFAQILQRISRSLNTNTAQHRGTPPPTRNISNSLGRTPSFYNPPTNIDVNLPFETSPWPFPSPLPVDESAELSMNFFRDLGLLEGGNDLSTGVDFWSQNLMNGVSGEGLDNTLEEFGNIGVDVGNVNEWEVGGDGSLQGW